jgi:hypothetical protein
MNDKVIEFPKNKVVRELPEEIHKARQQKADQKFADSVVDELSGFLLTELDNYNIPVENKQFAKDMVLVVDALRAAVYRSLDLEHHLHIFIDDNVKILEGNVEGLTKEELADRIAEMIEEIAKEKVDNEEEE